MALQVPIHGPVLCDIHVAAFFASILTMMISLWVSPHPHKIPTRQHTPGNLTAYMAVSSHCTSGTHQLSHSFYRKAFFVIFSGHMQWKSYLRNRILLTSRLIATYFHLTFNCTKQQEIQLNAEFSCCAFNCFL